MERVLIIDDEEDIAEILSLWVRDFGYESDSVSDVDSAIQLLNKEKYSAVFCDLKMPGRSGAELLDYINDTFSHLLPKFVLITGTIMDEELENFIRDRGAHILRKPFVLKDVRGIITSFER